MDSVCVLVVLYFFLSLSISSSLPFCFVREGVYSTPDTIPQCFRYCPPPSSFAFLLPYDILLASTEG